MLNAYKVVVIPKQNENGKLGKNTCMYESQFQSGRVDHGDDYFVDLGTKIQSRGRDEIASDRARVDGRSLEDSSPRFFYFITFTAFISKAFQCQIYMVFGLFIMFPSKDVEV